MSSEATTDTSGLTLLGRPAGLPESPEAKTILSAPEWALASVIACRSVPAPESLMLLTL